MALFLCANHFAGERAVFFSRLSASVQRNSNSHVKDTFRQTDASISFNNGPHSSGQRMCNATKRRTHTSSMLFIIILCRKHQFYSTFRRTVNVCVRRTSDGPQSDADHSHTNLNEFQKINYVEMVDTVLWAAAAAASVARAIYSKCLFMLPFKILQVVRAFYYFFTFLLRLIFILEPKENSFFFFCSSVQHARAHQPHTHTHGNDDGFSSKLSEGSIGPMSIFLLRPLKQNEINANQSNWMIIIIRQRSFKMSRRIND